MIRAPYKVSYDASEGAVYVQWRGLEPGKVVTRTQRMSALLQLDWTSDDLLVGIEIRAFDEALLYVAARVAQSAGCAFPRELTGITETVTVAERPDEEDLLRNSAPLATRDAR